MALMSHRAQRMCWSCSEWDERNFEGCLAVLQLFVLAKVEINKTIENVR